MAAPPSVDLAVGIAVDHDRLPDCGSLARRGVRVYRFPLRWSRMVTSTTFYHDRPAVPHEAWRSPDRPAADDDMAFWPHDDTRWHPIHADAWAGLPTAEVGIDLDAVHHYRALMTALRAHNVEPVPVLDPRDMPSVLRGVIGGWGSSLAIEAYAQFARVAFMQLGHLANLWLGLVLAAEPLARGPYAHRAARHMALGHARAASIYHRDLAGAAGVARGQFGAVVECAPMACDGCPCTRTDGRVDLDCLLQMFKGPSTAPPSTMDDNAGDGDDNDDDDDNKKTDEGDDGGGFAWGFTTSQRMVLSRSADVIVLECAPVAIAGYDDQQAAPRGAGENGVISAPRDMALAIDCAVAALPGAALVVCDGPAHSDPSYGDSTAQDTGDCAGQTGDPSMIDHRAGQDSCLMREDGRDDDDEHDDGDVDAIDVCVDGIGTADAGNPVGSGLGGRQWDERTAACLLERFGDVRSAVSMGRPVSAYLLRPARSHAPASPRADPFCL
ncbi:glycosyl hydrolase family 1 incomplete domain containing protein [Pandoravirus japonicus]|uniref:Glycosyl hydrolase family 1 incomplete domain containing protein n=1 Tax=Pandoravirus japonicus TaxID=2823154 RepID=A0A811BMC0_9VIRU|nr:glycosyl hydrolase family 1 incomplete domain containing protein [Pandoravirus japonicus]